MLTIIAFVVTLGILISIHEYGHFQVARWCGVKVLRFSIGFGRPLFSRRFGKDQTEFILAAFPLGGYVKMLDEREIQEGRAPVLAQDLPRAFNRQTVWKRIAIVLAGPFANLLLAILIYWTLFMHGITGMKPILGEVPESSAASQASMKAGELIQKVAGTPVATWQDVRWIILQHALNSPSVTVEAKSGENEVHLHNLPLNDLNEDDFEKDFLGKIGLKPYQPDVPARIGEIVADSAAEKAGLKAGDQVLKAGNAEISQWDELVKIVRKHPEQSLDLLVRRGDIEINVPVTPDVVEEDGQRIGRIGAAYHLEQSEIDRLLIDVRYPPLTAFSKAVARTWDTSLFSLRMFGNMLIGNASLKSISGPVTIASYAGQSAHIGWKSFLSFLALVSISLGVLNLLPIPVLDGGHLLYYMVEIFKGGPVSDKAMEIGQRIGLGLLGLLMAIAVYNDINRLITG